MIYDFEQKNMNFGTSKATSWKNYKHFFLHKCGSAQLEAFLKIRRKEANKIFDKCMELLGYDEVEKEA